MLSYRRFVDQVCRACRTAFFSALARDRADDPNFRSRRSHLADVLGKWFRGEGRHIFISRGPVVGSHRSARYERVCGTAPGTRVTLPVRSGAVNRLVTLTADASAKSPRQVIPHEHRNGWRRRAARCATIGLALAVPLYIAIAVWKYYHFKEIINLKRFVLWFGYMIGAAFCLANYVRATPDDRQQLRWSIVGTLVGVVALIGIDIASRFDNLALRGVLLVFTLAAPCADRHSRRRARYRRLWIPSQWNDASRSGNRITRAPRRGSVWRFKSSRRRRERSAYRRTREPTRPLRTSRDPNATLTCERSVSAGRRMPRL